MFGTICALATFDRSELKEKVLSSQLFRKFLEAEPKFIELLQKFVKSQFGICFDILEEVCYVSNLKLFFVVHIVREKDKSFISLESYCEFMILLL